MSHTTAVSIATARRAPRHKESRGIAGLSSLEKIVLMALAAALVAVALGPASGAEPGLSYSEIRVQDGQSLWEIATTHRVPGATTAQIVELIAEKNEMDGFTVAGGSTLLVPIVDSGNDLVMR